MLKDMKTSYLPQLETLGLSSNEAKVYLALLETGQTSAGELIKKTRLHRSVVYETLDKLIAQKLAFTLTRQHIAHFQALDPERIVHNIDRQRSVALDLVPNLKKLIDTKSPEITVYEGVESYKRFWLEAPTRMPIGSTDYVAGSIGSPWFRLMGEKAVDFYMKTSHKRKIGWKMIIFDIDDYEQTFRSKYPNFRWENRLIEKKVFKEGNFNIFGNESVVLHSATEPMIIEVKNQSLVKIFQNIFDILWDSAREIPEKGIPKNSVSKK